MGFKFCLAIAGLRLDGILLVHLRGFTQGGEITPGRGGLRGGRFGAEREQAASITAANSTITTMLRKRLVFIVSLLDIKSPTSADRNETAKHPRRAVVFSNGMLMILGTILKKASSEL